MDGDIKYELSLIIRLLNDRSIHFNFNDCLNTKKAQRQYEILDYFLYHPMFHNKIFNILLNLWENNQINNFKNFYLII